MEEVKFKMSKLYKVKIKKQLPLDSELIEFTQVSYVPWRATLVVENYNTSISLFLLNQGYYKDFDEMDKIIEDYYYDTMEDEYYFTLRNKTILEHIKESADDLIRDIKNIPRTIDNILWNIKNILSWIKVLWNNWDFDMDFHLILSIHKLKQMERFFRKDAQVLSKYKSAYYLRRAIYYGEKALENSELDVKQIYLDEYYNILRDNHIQLWD